MKNGDLVYYENTADFDKNAPQNPAAAMCWLCRAYRSDKRYKKNQSWLLARQRVLFAACCEQKEKGLAAALIYLTPDYFSQIGRIEKFKKFFGSWNFPLPELKFKEKKRKRAIINTATFRAALYEGRIIEAEIWLNKKEIRKKYDKKTLQHRSKELEMAKKAANKMLLSQY